MPALLRRRLQTKGFLTPATAMDVEYVGRKYHFDKNIYANRVFDSKGEADPTVEIKFGPNIKDWPQMPALPENLVLKVVSEIHDPVTTTDELIPSGETSSYRSIRWDWPNLHYPGKTRRMWDEPKNAESAESD